MELEEYEFSKRNNKLISRLSNDMRFVGIFLKVAGWMSLFGSFLTGWLDSDWASSFWGIFSGIVSLVLGLRAIEAANFFKQITVGKGDDMKNIMNGFEQVNRLYKFEFWSLFAIALLSIVLGTIQSMAVYK